MPASIDVCAWTSSRHYVLQIREPCCIFSSLLFASSPSFLRFDHFGTTATALAVSFWLRQLVIYNPELGSDMNKGALELLTYTTRKSN
jgi:hypothetical protein